MRDHAAAARRASTLLLLVATVGACASMGRGPTVLRPGSDVTRPLRRPPRVVRTDGQTCATVPLAAVVFVLGEHSTCTRAVSDAPDMPVPSTLPPRP